MNICQCPSPPMGSNICHCTVCHETFNSVSSYEAHRPGKTFPIACLTPAQMEARGMLRNEAGRWITKAYAGPFVAAQRAAQEL